MSEPSKLDRALAFADSALGMLPSLDEGPVDEIAIGGARAILAGIRAALQRRTKDEVLAYLQAIQGQEAARLDVDSIAAAVGRELAKQRDTEPPEGE